ncbi:MAG: class I SAM-dependent methyltransferase [Chloroflexi bacterium]|nr:class I SAM-dependent methyltransferase [Chloroflexota bacterium]
MPILIVNQHHPDARAGLAQRFFAWTHIRGGSPEYARAVAEHKRALFADLRGPVLEIGPGDGANFEYLPAGVRWVGLEPNVFFHDHLRALLADSGIDGEVRAGVAERLDFADSSFDAVISTLVLCSVTDQATVLSEIRRVLRPGGRFIFIEHVAAPAGSSLRRTQRWIKPIWRVVADGCHPDRDTAAAIARAGFAQVEITPFRAPIPVASPQIAGTAHKAED